MSVGRALALLGALAPLACAPERVEYHYRPDYMAQNAGRPSEEVFYKPDGTKVVISSKLPGTVVAPQPAASPEAGAGAADAGQIAETARPSTPDGVLEVFMMGLRDESYGDVYDRLVSPQQRERMGGASGREGFVRFCRDNRRELMASSLRLVTAIRSGDSRPEELGSDMLRFRLPERDRRQFGFTVLEVERTPTGLGLAGIR